MRRTIRRHHRSASRQRLVLAALALAFGPGGRLAESRTAGTALPPERITPVMLRPLAAPIPFAGSDGAFHLVYELAVTNFSSGEAILERLEVLDRGTASVAASVDRAELAGRLQPAGRRDAVPSLAASMAATLFLHLRFPSRAAVPGALTHRLTVRALAAPPDQQQITAELAPLDVDPRAVPVLGPPLAGEGFLAGDACCDATRHTRAILPIGGALRVAQRYAVDWEQLDAERRIYVGPRTDPKSYTIYGKEALAVADATVASVVDGLPEQVPSELPASVPIAEADGNAVILALGGGAFALYAHLQPGSIRVAPGQRVRRGEVLGLVGNSGNSSAPHLHFHVMDGPSALASNGVPSVVEGFTITGVAPGTDAFDHAEATGTPLPVRAVEPPTQHAAQMPLDLAIVRFPRVVLDHVAVGAVATLEPIRDRRQRPARGRGAPRGGRRVR